MDRLHNAFGSYEEAARAGAAVDRLVEAGFAPADITVLLKENPVSIDFAALKGTKVPDGIDRGPKADLPLEGSWGLINPGEGPKAGALDTALNGMGVPLDWPHGVLQGKALVAVACNEANGCAQAEAVLEATGAEEIGTSKGTAPKATSEVTGQSAARVNR